MATKKDDFLSLWDKVKDKDTEIEIKENDLSCIIDGYGFVIQKDGNVVLRKISDCHNSIKDVFIQFKAFLEENGITHIRVEGTLRRYNFLERMFPTSHFVRDEEIKDRNVFYIKV